MFVIHVTPIRKSFGLEVLSYFSKENVPVGSIVSVPLRKVLVKALVLESISVEQSKAEIRSADFSLRKVEKLEAQPFLSPVWMESVRKLSEFYAVSYGAAIAALLPSVFMKNLSENFMKKFWVTAGGQVRRISEENSKTNVSFSEQLFSAFQGNDEERISHYKSIIREEFAKKQSVFLCVSGKESAERAKRIFEKGIEKYLLVFSSGMSKEKLFESLERLKEAKHPLLIIATPQWLFLPVQNLGTIILDGEQEPGWKTLNRPFIDVKKFAEIFAFEAGIKFVMGDSILSAETLWKYKQYDPYKFETLNFRASLGVKPEIVDMKKKKEEAIHHPLLSSELLEIVLEAKEKGKNIFIFSTRKGLSSVTVCRDCGEQVLCHNCGSPVVLYKGKEVNIFKCHQCGEMRSAEEVCRNCGSWRLLPLGVGVERVKEELEKNIPHLKIFEINKEATPTSSKVKKVYEEFSETVGGILIGTEMALQYIQDGVDIAIVASIDALFAIPDYHVREKIFHLILKIGFVANETFLIQTRNAERETVEMAVAGNMLDFYKREIKEREEMNYPPFSIFIKITCRGAKPFVKTEMAKIAKIFKPYNPAIFPSTSEKQGAPHAENAVMKVAQESWPDQKLLSLIRSLPPFFEIKVDPDNLL